MLEKQLRQFIPVINVLREYSEMEEPGFTYSACRTFSKHHERIPK